MNVTPDFIHITNTYHYVMHVDPGFFDVEMARFGLHQDATEYVSFLRTTRGFTADELRIDTLAQHVQF